MTLLDCEGSRCPTHLYKRPEQPESYSTGICAMCGERVPCSIAGTATDHKRLDVLAELGIVKNNSDSTIDPENDPDLTGDWVNGFRIKNPPQGEYVDSWPIQQNNSKDEN